MSHRLCRPLLFSPRHPPHPEAHCSTPCLPPLCCLLKGLHHHAVRVGLDVPAGSIGGVLQAQPLAPDPSPCPSGVPRTHSLSVCRPEGLDSGLALGTGDLKS